jgi:ubiquinone/menaquinone biosynthesis C-methylase UbiE
MSAAIVHDAEVAARFDALVERFKPEVGAVDCRLTAILDNLPSTRSARVLDLGCGKGRFARQVERAGYRVVGVDVSSRMLEQSRGLNRVKASARRLPFDDSSFDAVFAIETLEHVRDIAEVVREARRVLRPGGRFIVIDKNMRSLDARRPWLPSVLIKWIDERRGRWMYPVGGPVRERWFVTSALTRLLKNQFASVSTEHLLRNSEAGHIVFRAFPPARLLTCWTAVAEGGES